MVTSGTPGNQVATASIAIMNTSLRDLTENEVKYIQRNEDQLTIKQLSDKFGVSQMIIKVIIVQVNSWESV